MKQDYIEILKTKLSQRCSKNSHYSLRAFARDLGISPQRLSHVLNGKHGLSPKAATEIAEKLVLSESEKALFCALVEQKHGRSKIIRAEAQEKLKNIGDSYRNLNLDHFKIIADWYHFAIMELTLVEGFKSEPKWIATALGISEINVKLAIERLLKLEMLETKNGHLHLSGQFFTDPQGIPSEAVRNFHRQLMQKAMESLDFQDLGEREVSSTILAIDSEDYDSARKDLQNFRKEFDKKYSAAKKKNKVYCLGFQFFRLQANF